MLVLAGPAGFGKASVAHALGRRLGRVAHVTVEALREPGRFGLVSRVHDFRGARVSAPVPSPDTWSGSAAEVRERAVAIATSHAGTGLRVVIEDGIEGTGELAPYLGGLAEADRHVVTLLPSLEEMALRDTQRPSDRQAGPRLAAVFAGIRRQLDADTIVLDTGTDTVEDTVQRIFNVLV